MSNWLYCPHNRRVSPLEQEGLVVYVHQDDGSHCQLLNRFDTTIDEILYSDMLGILNTQRYASFCSLGASLAEVKRLNLEEDGCLIEFMLIFKRSRRARQAVFAELARLCRTKAFAENLVAQKLFYLVAVVYTEPQWQREEREYQKLLEEFFQAYGRQFAQAMILVLGGPIPQAGSLSNLLGRLQFIQKYVFPLRKADAYAIL